MNAQDELKTPEHMLGMDPDDALEILEYEDPNPQEITDPTHHDYVEPAADVKPAQPMPEGIGEAQEPDQHKTGQEDS